MNNLQPEALSGLRVLDCATFIAGPYCATFFAEFGAEVIKVELPKVGDPTRKFGTPTSCGDSLIWLSESRNKKYVKVWIRDHGSHDMPKFLLKILSQNAFVSKIQGLDLLLQNNFQQILW